MTISEKETMFNFLSTAKGFLCGFSDSNERMETSQQGGMTLSVLAQKVKQCERCNLSKTRQNTVFGQGVQNPEVLVVGEGPGETEDEQGLPFVGKAGQLLDKMLIAINLSRNTNCYITNVVKCRPPQNRNPAPDECCSCKSYLDSQIHLLKPKMILCVGKIAANQLFKCSDTVGNMRGKVFEVQGIKAMMTYHPSALLRDESLKRPAWEDLKLFRIELEKILKNS